MIEKIGGVIALILGIFTFGYIKGGNNERNKSRKRAIKVVKKAKDIQDAIDSADACRNRSRLYKWSRNKR